MSEGPQITDGPYEFRRSFLQAFRIAARAHDGQKDWFGGEYILHPVEVSSYCRTERGSIAALLHDVVEDSDVTLDDLRAAGIDEKIVTAVDLLTKREGDGLHDYYKRVSSNDIAAEVKFADMRHNSSRNMEKFPTKEEAEKVYRRYLDRAKQLLILVGEDRTAELTTKETYDWLMS
jgi:(p)ppGpp synthase/HD superfamily hydrolase